MIQAWLNQIKIVRDIGPWYWWMLCNTIMPYCSVTFLINRLTLFEINRLTIMLGFMMLYDVFYYYCSTGDLL